jgi:hypothetical protein
MKEKRCPLKMRHLAVRRFSGCIYTKAHAALFGTALHLARGCGECSRYSSATSPNLNAVTVQPAVNVRLPIANNFRGKSQVRESPLSSATISVCVG